jgi:4-amino-4-deoxy-L-arabinose transferase-like glycosyltransferase
VAALYLVGLGSTDLWAPDEPRYAHVASEIFSMEHGARGLVVLHVNGEPYTQKPPLYFWLAALTSLPGGAVGEVSARLPSALAGIAAVALTFLLGRRLFDTRTAALGAALLATVFDFAFLARRARLDVLLTLTVVAALLAFWRLHRGVGSRRANAAWLHGAMGLGVLTKGPVALLPLLVAAVYLAWQGRLGEWRRTSPAWAWLLSAGPVLAWISGAVLLTPEGFFDEAVVENTFGRFFMGVSKHEPWYFFLYQFPVNFLPWSLLWPLVFLEWRRRGRRPADQREGEDDWRFLLVWVATYFVFFSISTGKRGLYLLPAFPGAALLCAAALESWLARSGTISRRASRAALGFFAALGVVGLVVALLGGRPLPAEPAVSIPGGFGIALAAAALVAALAWRTIARRGTPVEGGVGVLVALVATVELAVFTLLHPAFEPTKSARPIAEAALAVTEPGTRFGLYRHSAMLGGLVFYGGQPVARLGNEDDVRRFLEGGGRVIAAQAHALERLQRVAPFEVVASQRSGKRRYLVLRVQPEASASARRGP